MSDLLAPVESPILDADGKPFVTMQPVRVDRDCPTDMVYLIAKFNVAEDHIENWARRCGVITNVRVS